MKASPLHKHKKKWAWISFIALGLASTLWFLIRVIPKPSRATYPCMRAAAPFMSSFVIWLMGIMASGLLFRRSLRFMKQARVPLALGLLLMSGLAMGLVSIHSHQKASASILEFMATEDDIVANTPYGEARGIFPGRVSWFWNPDAVNQLATMTVNGDGVIDESDNVFFLRKNNNEGIVDGMLDSLVLNLTGETSLPAAWDAVFRYHNNSRNGKDAGYSEGETVFIKTNNQGIGLAQKMYPDMRQEDATIWGSYPMWMSATTPYSILATVKHLVNEAGVPQENIYIGDPHKNFNNIYYDIIREEFAQVHILGVVEYDVTDPEAHGRTLSIEGTEDIMFYSDRGDKIPELSDKFYTQQVDADYIINIAAMKGHVRGGITMFCKSHFGSHTRESAAHLHPGLVAPDKDPINAGYGKYRVLADLMGHERLGGNTMLFILDALWGGSYHELFAPRKWDMAPFKGNYTASMFVSQDPVAIAAVGHDFLRTEYNVADWGDNAVPNILGVDDYLMQAADSQFWPEGITYDPENDGTSIASLGTHEHWDNASDMRYSRNLDAVGGTGIELVKLHEKSTVGVDPSPVLGDALKLYPNPARHQVYLSMDNAYEGRVEGRIYGLNGQELSGFHFDKVSRKMNQVVSLEDLAPGTYVLALQMGQQQLSRSLVVGK